MRILILGGTAFLSAEIARQSVIAGHSVTCLARASTRLPPPGARLVRADRSGNADAYEALEGDWDAVVEVARDPVQARQALKALAGRTRHWTFVSSCSVYARHDIPGGDESAALLAALPEGASYSADVYGEAKVAIEAATNELVGDRAHIVRAGLIAGPGDETDRYGYWPARFARSQHSSAAGETDSQVLVPDVPDQHTQVIDVRDVAAWVLDAAGRGIAGTYNAVGDVVPFADVVAASERLARQLSQDPDGGRVLGGANWFVRPAPERWLVAHGVGYWSGPDSLPLWLPPQHEGFSARSNAAARNLGLQLRPWEDTLQATLDDELARGLNRRRNAGMSPATEAALLAELAAR
ncbi:NAD-dependent epimerase/dehydratase family protein [Arthrobacter sp. M4]|uniref:NAD-dependent epimerase/dehydratase family protein n=1 Tax=Arthrobacter sp. M4 TaxID=218160 RepID=UPI001CDCC9AD|nr:NAD-dependent epimerase/dehydratase family protein [Arthrobacter sp. M4]MCA4131245.1 epimerase [Arthrobacter sp. M4]